MATNSVEICNRALTDIGARRITALSDPSKEGRACNDNYDISRKAVLRLHPWNFAIERVEITGVEVDSIADDGTGLIEVTTATVHGFTTGDRVTVSGVIGTSEANVTGEVTVSSTTVFTFDDSTFANTYVSGGVAALAAAYEYGFSFALPSDCLRVWTVSDASDNVLTKNEFRIESGRILTNHALVRLKYVKNVTTTTLFDTLFDELLAAHVANAIAYKITGSEAAKQMAMQNLKAKMQAARFVDSVEDPSVPLDGDEWIRSRWDTNQGYVRDPMT